MYKDISPAWPSATRTEAGQWSSAKREASSSRPKQDALIGCEIPVLLADVISGAPEQECVACIQHEDI